MPNLLPSLGRRKLPMLDMPKLGGGASDVIGSIAYFASNPGPKYAKCDGRFLSGLQQNFPFQQAPDYPVQGGFSGSADIGGGSPISLLRFLNGTFLATVGTAIYTSSDATNWAAAGSRDNGGWTDAAYGKGLYVVVCNNDPYYINSSPDGITWTRRAISLAAMNAIHFNGSMFVAVGADMIWSDDGITWNRGSWDGAANVNAVTFLNGVWYVYGGDGQYNYRSTDGKNWTRGAAIAVLSGWSVNAAKVSNGRIMLCSRGTTRFHISDDGSNYQGIDYNSLYTGAGIGCVVPMGPFIFVGDQRGYVGIYQDDILINRYTLTGNSGGINDAAYGVDRSACGLSTGVVRSAPFGPIGLRVPKTTSILRPNGDRLQPYMRIAP